MAVAKLRHHADGVDPRVFGEGVGDDLQGLQECSVMWASRGGGVDSETKVAPGVDDGEVDGQKGEEGEEADKTINTRRMKLEGGGEIK